MNVDVPLTPIDEWVDAWEAARHDGYDRFDFLAGIDRGSVIEVVGHCWSERGSRFLRTESSDAVPSICAVFPAADWFEREIAEMFGINIGSGAPLLVRDEQAAAPLRKTEPLPARQQRDWPGSRGSAPGVLDTWTNQ